MKNNGYGFNCALFALGAVLFGFGGWGLSLGLKSLHFHFLLPTFGFLQWYFANYGRVTIEFMAAAFLITSGLVFFKCTITSMGKNFAVVCKEFETKRDELQNKYFFEVEKNARLQKEKNTALQEISILHEKKRTLESEIVRLKIELEAMVNPKKVAERVQEKEKAEATNELLEHVGQTHWRAM